MKEIRLLTDEEFELEFEQLKKAYPNRPISEFSELRQLLAVARKEKWEAIAKDLTNVELI